MLGIEIFLATIILASVLLIGLLISIGNERQRNELCNLRKQIESWAIENLRNQRTRMLQETRVEDPLAWLNRTAISVLGIDPHLQGVQQVHNPDGIQVWSADGDRLLFSLHAPAVFRTASKSRAGRKLQAGGHPLLPYDRRTVVYDLSALTTGTQFDVELGIAWKALSGHEVQESHLWLYLIPRRIGSYWNWTRRIIASLKNPLGIFEKQKAG
jgi:hypothetical protein